MSATKIKNVIKKFNRFLITSHINPEGDSIGSQIAVASLLKRLQKDVVILNESPVPQRLQFMKGTEKILKKMPCNFDFQAAIILDCPDMTRTGKVSEHITKEKIVINIDHHISNQMFGKYNWVDINLSSAGEMVFELFSKFESDIEYDEAVSMYVAIMTDTGSFRYNNTSSNTHMIASHLINRGVNPYEIYGKIYETNNLQDTNLLGEALRTLRLTNDGKVAWLWVTKEMLKKTKASLEGIEGIIDFARSIESVEVAILFRETGTDDKIKVSFRSKGKADVNKLASFFDGGGHVRASGCSVFGKMEEVEKKVLEKARKMVKD